MDNQAATPFGYCPSIVFLFVQPHCLDDETNANKILTVSALKNWRRPPGRPRTRWLKTIQQDLRPEIQ